MQSYYQEKLSDLSLQKCYEIASPRIQQYLQAEIRHVLRKVHPKDMVLELSCGYGRVVSQLTPAEFRELTSIPGIKSQLLEVDESCLFCEIVPL